MKCEEALALLDDYVECELEDQAAYRLTSHLDECEACARARRSLQREQEVYSRFLLDVEATPLLWSNLRQSMEAEDARHEPRSLSWLGAWTQSVFSWPSRVPIFAAMTMIIAASILAFVVMRPNSRTQNPQLAENQPVETPRQPDTLATSTPPTSTPATGSEASSQVGPRQELPRRSKPKTGRREVAAPRIASADMGTWLRKLTESDERFVPASSSFISSAEDSEAAQHAQKAEVLLRSFRNIAAQRGAGLDVSYEKQQSRELLARNILLRREAQTSGDLATEELLSRLEPILIDIANLPPRSSSRDVWQIKEQMRKEGIVSALHFKQTSPAVF